MDAIQFGRWIGERRRKHGWSSQRAFVESLHSDPFLKDARISEDFVARLEAGRLTYPFRGSVRWHVFELAWMLCKTNREVQSYLLAASLRDLSPVENEHIQRLYARISPHPTFSIEFLPVRPQHLIGRDVVLHTMLEQICSMEHGLYAVTGMPGVGKSALTAELVHRLAAYSYRHIFQDGIVTLSCTGRQGASGLILLLNEIIEIFSPRPELHSATYVVRLGKNSSDVVHRLRQDAPSLLMLENLETDLAIVIDHLHMLLMDKHVLFLLDDVDPQFPLREAVEALSSSTQHVPSGQASKNKYRHVVLTTGRHIPAPALINYHQHVQPLEHAAALELFITLASTNSMFRTSLAHQEQSDFVGQLCSALGYLPLAIELVANSVAVKGIPLSLLAANTQLDPFQRLLDSDSVLLATFERAFQSYSHVQQEHFALLALLGPHAFSLKCAAALCHGHNEIDRQNRVETGNLSDILPLLTSTQAYGTRSVSTHVFSSRFQEHSDMQEQVQVGSTHVPLLALTETALELGDFVHHSLLELVVEHDSDVAMHNPCYRLHPLLYAFACRRLQQLPQERILSAWKNVQTYTDAYVQRYQGNVEMLEREREVLLDVFQVTWQEQQYEYVMRWASALSVLVKRLEGVQVGERLLQRGIQASCYMQDHYQLAYLTSQLGTFYCQLGKIEEAREQWQRCLELAQEGGQRTYLWQPYLYLAHIEYMQGNIQAAQTLTNDFLYRTRERGDARSLIIAYLKRGIYRRILGEIDDAYTDICSALSLVFVLNGDAATSDQWLELAARAELARILGDYPHALAYTESALEQATLLRDTYSMALLLFVQTQFALSCQEYGSAYALAERTLEVAPENTLIQKQAARLLENAADGAHTRTNLA